MDSDKRFDLRPAHSAMRELVDERGWDRLHTPSNLVVALATEVSELLDLTLWKAPPEIDAMFRRDAPGVSGEIADIFINLLSLVSKTDIDPNVAVREKVDKLLKRHSLTPVGSSRGQDGKCLHCGVGLEPGWEWCPVCGTSRYSAQVSPLPHLPKSADEAQHPESSEEVERWNRVAREAWERRPASQRWVSEYVLRPAVEAALGGPLDELLDVGCGDASISAGIAERFGSRLIAFDPAKEMRRLARRNVDERNVIANLDLVESNSILSAMANMVLSTVQEPRSLLLDVRRVLVPGARFVVTVPHPCFTLLREIHRTTRRRDLETTADVNEFAFAGPLANYFDTVREEVEWDLMRVGGPVTHIYNRTLSDYFDLFAECGFSVRNLHEPTPLAGGESPDPALFRMYSRIPGFLVMELEKDPYFRGLG